MLDSTCFRIGLLGALRSKSLGGRVVGLMVTASHNPEPDNGVKMVDAHGEMLAAAWEPACTRVANAASADELMEQLQAIVAEFQIVLKQPARVVYGRDTRPSSPRLAGAIAAGLAAMGAEAIDAGLLTTPQLHYLVLAHNTQHDEHPAGVPTADGYYAKFAGAYAEIMRGGPRAPAVLVDCANGVGAQALQGCLNKLPAGLLDAVPVRAAMMQPGALNNSCGADFVKTHQSLPDGYEHEAGVAPGRLLCSFDGDADRIVFYYLTGPAAQPESFHLLDGDKIASLLADYLSELVREAQLDTELQLGCVQTAYANGAATEYLQSRVPVAITKTGVKHLHHEAERFDIGVYFEANGHGTVLFSPRAIVAFDVAESSDSDKAKAAARRLRALALLINQSVGDALSDLLAVLVVLAARGWGPEQWDECYTDLPNRLLKVQVADRTQFQTFDAERRLAAPQGLQALIDELVSKVPRGRAFVRPSGTEDCVRVYAEAAKPAAAEKLAADVAKVAESV